MTDAIQAVVVHKGAREHFLAARALHRQDMLAALVTDWYSPVDPAWARRLSFLGPGVTRALGAASADLPRSRVIGLNAFGLASRRALRRPTGEHPLAAIGRNDQAFAERVTALPLPPHNVFFAYSYAALEAIRAAKSRGALTVVDQIDPGRTEWDLVRDEARRWPQYATDEGDPPAGYYERAVAEWREADITVVNSAWSRDALVRQGADPARIEIVPLAFEAEAAPAATRPAAEPLTVLWIGSVIVRKGIQYLVEAARELAGEPVRFIVAGPIGIRDEAIRAAPPNIQWLGAIPRSDARRLYESAHVFVLPTISDGFAITQVEALAHGLPVIATPNCGDVVRDGETGFLVPARDAKALAAAIRRFIKDPKRATSMRDACLAAARGFSIDAFGRRLAEIFRKGLAARGGTRR